MNRDPENYVTIFDSLFVPQALALIESMKRHAGAFVLWVIAMDDLVVEMLVKLNLPEIRVIPIFEVENADLLRVKPSRTRGEYCWTVTPFSPDAVFARDASVERVTYLDADLWFLKSPQPIFSDFEASNAAVLITEHAFAAQRDESVTSGRFCVQFMTFVRDRSDPIRHWWQERCIEWCFSYYDDGKLGDQKYLDHFPGLFGDDVHIASQYSWCLGPWNCERYPHGEAIFFHFHGVRFTSRKRINVGAPLPPFPTWRNVYLPYFSELATAISRLEQSAWVFRPQQAPRSLLRTIFGTWAPSLRTFREMNRERKLVSR